MKRVFVILSILVSQYASASAELCTKEDALSDFFKIENFVKVAPLQVQCLMTLTYKTVGRTLVRDLWASADKPIGVSGKKFFVSSAVTDVTALGARNKAKEDCQRKLTKMIALGRDDDNFWYQESDDERQRNASGFTSSGEKMISERLYLETEVVPASVNAKNLTNWRDRPAEIEMFCYKASKNPKLTVCETQAQSK